MNPTSAVLALLVLLPRLDDDKEVLELGRSCFERFYAGEVAETWDRCDEKMQQALGSLETFETFHAQAFAQLGDEVEVLDESVELQGTARVYRRKSHFEKYSGVIEVVCSFGAEDRISGFLIRPQAQEAPSEYLDYQTKTALRLPFEGEWFVFWGGRKLEQNYHAATVDQRFAYDLMIMKDGASHTGDGKENEDYHCFDLPILAPGAGTVVVAIDGIEDNVPGEMNAKQIAGNHVVLDHGNGEFSFLAHFKKGSLGVKVGDKVAAGALLGRCGNSGNSSEPHLHYHVQTTAELRKGAGLPVQFRNYLADGQPVERGEPVKGQRIASR